jgi:uncharacterized protein YjbI with pentapeptide repeats
VNILDPDGKIVASSDPADTRRFDGMIIENAFLAGQELEGISFEGSILRSCNFGSTDLYGANFSDADCDSCSFKSADLRSSTLFGAKFRNSDLQGASFAIDEMGAPTLLFEVDFSSANLNDTNFDGALFDESTTFPRGFDLNRSGLRPRGLAEPPQRR